MTEVLANVTVADLVGMAGVLLYTTNFFLVTMGHCSSHSIAFFVRTGLAAGCVLFSLLHDFNFASLTIQVFYIVLSLIGIAARLRRPMTA